jgi:hypothetical protein
MMPTWTVQALIKALVGRDGTFVAYDIRRPCPKADPLGTLISGYTPSVRTVGSNNRSLSLKGVRSGYDLTVGDYLVIKRHRPAVAASADGKHLGQRHDDGRSSKCSRSCRPGSPSIRRSISRSRAGKFKIVAGSYTGRRAAAATRRPASASR